jgi:hypothetical protein
MLNEPFRAIWCIPLVVLAATFGNHARAQTLLESRFDEGADSERGWQVDGAWDVFTHPADTKNNPGPLLRFAANKPAGSATKTFDKVDNPRKLVLSLDYGWGWGDANQPADSVSFMLLNDAGDGYCFVVHRCKETWAAQWGKAEGGKRPSQMTWAGSPIDATRKSVRDGGGLSRLVITREAGGAWTMASKDWNAGKGGAVQFTDTTTRSFSKLVLLGTENFDEQLFDNVVLEVPDVEATTAVPANDFLNSIGVVTTFPDRGQPIDKTIEMVKYCGFRWVRGGIEGLSEKGPTTIDTYLQLHKQTGVKFSWGLVSGGSDVEKLIRTAKPLAATDALLAFEGNNEPNNWGVKYQGEDGGGRAKSWMAVAKLQRDMYAAVKGDSALAKYPVWSISENGAQVDNVGLQFLEIPEGMETLLPAGTKFADFANVHNYIYHPGSPNVEDNKTWNAADPTSACKVDGLFGNYGTTWAKKFRGYTEAELMTLPRVTTETGTTIGGQVTEEIHGRNLMSLYLAQFKRGYQHTAVYLLRDRTDEGGNQAFGFYDREYGKRKAAVYLHNLTTILSDDPKAATAFANTAANTAAKLKYTIRDQPATMHDLLLQKSDGALCLVVWNERVKGEDTVVIDLGEERRGVGVFDPTVGVDAVAKHEKARELKLTLSDHPLVLMLDKK